MSEGPLPLFWDSEVDLTHPNPLGGTVRCSESASTAMMNAKTEKGTMREKFPNHLDLPTL